MYSIGLLMQNENLRASAHSLTSGVDELLLKCSRMIVHHAIASARTRSGASRLDSLHLMFTRSKIFRSTPQQAFPPRFLSFTNQYGNHYTHVRALHVDKEAP